MVYGGGLFRKSAQDAMLAKPKLRPGIEAESSRKAFDSRQGRATIAHPFQRWVAMRPRTKSSQGRQSADSLMSPLLNGASESFPRLTFSAFQLLLWWLYRTNRIAPLLQSSRPGSSLDQKSRNSRVTHLPAKGEK